MYRGRCLRWDLIDKYITPFLLSSGTPNFSPLAHAIGRVAVIFTGLELSRPIHITGL